MDAANHSPVPGRALAYYLWPPQWIGEPPACMEHDAQPGFTPQGEVRDAIVTADLLDGGRVRAFRDGMIAFVAGDLVPTYESDFLGWSNGLVRLMNAHLACLHASIGGSPLLRCPPITLWTAIQVDFDSGAFRGMSDQATGGALLSLYNARQSFPQGYDWRFERGPFIAISRDGVDGSFSLLRDLLRRPARDKVLLRAEMLARAKAALADVDYTGALTAAWTTVEGILSELVTRYLDDNQDRPTGRDASGNAMKFINADRRKFLQGSDMTVRHSLELLSLADVLPFGLYKDCLEGTSARNRWLHAEASPSPLIAARVLSAAGDLFELAEAVPLKVLDASSYEA